MRNPRCATYKTNTDFIGRLRWEGLEYEDSAELRKGKHQPCAAANANVNSAKQAQGIANQMENIANPETNTSGGLSPPVSKQLANRKGQTDKGTRQMDHAPRPLGLAVDVFGQRDNHQWREQ